MSKENVNTLVEFRDTMPNGATIEQEIVSAVLNLPHEKFSLMLNSLSFGLKNVLDTYNTALSFKHKITTKAPLPDSERIG